MRHPLRIHTRLRYEGEIYTVTAMNGAILTLTPRKGHPMLIAVNLLLSAEDFAILDESDQPVDNKRQQELFLEANLPEDVLSPALELEYHLNELRTGYRSGDPSSPTKGEPRKEYDPAVTTLSERKKAKAAELGCTVRKLEQNLAKYASLGLEGIVDKRRVRKSSRKTDARLLSVMDEIFKDMENGSNVSLITISRRVERLVATRVPDLVLPSRPTLNRIIREYGALRGVFLDAKTRRGLAVRPPTPFRRFVSAFLGEAVIIDSTRLDSFAWDESSNQWVQVQLTLAMEVFSRSIVAWRFTPVSDRGVDAALILKDIIFPKPVRKGWPSNIRWSYPGVPENVVIQMFGDTRFEMPEVAAIPFVTPDNVIVDHGKIYLSRTFRDACTRLGISIQLARPKTPTDKAPLERAFRTIRERFVEALPGYKGPSVAKRGLNIEQQAFYILDELEELFAEWVATYWQCRIHEGLDIPDLPKLGLCPNDMYNLGIARTGFLQVPPGRNLFYELLESAWREIEIDGVSLHGLRYDAEILNDYRNLRSNQGGKNREKYPFRFDPRNLAEIYFYVEADQIWHTIPWRGSSDQYRPFNRSVLQWAKALIVDRQHHPYNEIALEETLNALLDRIEQGAIYGRKERIRAARHAIEARLHHAERSATDDDVDLEGSLFNPFDVADSRVFEFDDETFESETIVEDFNF